MLALRLLNEIIAQQKILVRIQLRHLLGFLVLTDLPRNFLTVGTHVYPSMH